MCLRPTVLESKSKVSGVLIQLAECPNPRVGSYGRRRPSTTAVRAAPVSMRARFGSSAAATDNAAPFTRINSSCASVGKRMSTESILRRPT